MKSSLGFALVAIAASFARPLCAADGGERGEVVQIAEIEKRAGGRLGVAALDLETGRRVEHRANERFAMCSTFKFLLAAAVLHRVEHEQERLDRVIPYTPADFQEHAPVTKAHAGEGGMTVEALCAAAVEYSDNTAANLLLGAIDGPAGLTSYVRTLGDELTRLDRKEPEMNRVGPDDPRDTTSPEAMLADMKKLLLGDALSQKSRTQLEAWLIGNTTGAGLIRAGVPPAWRVGDKTGRGGNGSVNDVAIIRPPGRAPILLSIYFTDSTISPKEREATIAETTRVVIERFR